MVQEAPIERILPWPPSQIVAGLRLALALIYLLALYADPEQPVRDTPLGALVLAAFMAWSALLLLTAMRDWWIEFRLAPVALAIDCLVGVGSVYFTEGARQEFAMPLVAFFVFTLVSAMLLAGWRTTLVVGVAVPLGIVGVAGVLAVEGAAVDWVRIGRRFGYFLVIAALVVWYGGRRTLPGAPRLATVPQPGSPVPLHEALAYAKATFGFARGAIVWRPRSKPPLVATSPEGGPDLASTLDSRWLAQRETPGSPVLIRGPGKAIELDAELRPVRCRTAANPAEAERRGEALLVPFEACEGEGVLVLSGISPTGRDLLPLAASAGREIGLAFDRHAASLRAYEENVDRLRDSVARDLHDSVAQSLAGACYRIEAAQKSLDRGRDAQAELAAVGQALRAEQRSIRTIIERLRDGREIRARHSLADELQGLFAELELHWGAAIELHAPQQRVEVGTSQLHDLRQIAREAVANAARHGQARTIAFTLTAGEHEFHLDIVDDGSGSTPGEGFAPQSIGERVAALGGKLDARSGPAGSRIYLTIPRLSA